MRGCLVVLVLYSVLACGLCYKPDPTATKPPIPPPPPPIFTFRQQAAPSAVVAFAPTPAPQARAEVFELIAPNQIQGGFNPSLTLGNPDYTVGFRPQQTRPRPQRPNLPSRPQQQLPRPPRPQRPQQQRLPRPQRPFSQVVARPPIPVPPRPFG